MKILIRSKGSDSWEEVESVTYNAEAEIQRLLSESPSLIPLDEVSQDASPLLVGVREFGLPGSGSTDLLAFSADGDVAVIECKLDANPESKRKVIGQILEYGAFLWGMSYEELDGKVQAREGRSLVDLVADAIGEEEWDAESFREEVSEALASGTFILVIAVDNINSELARTIRFINNCVAPGMSFVAIEMERFERAGVEILVPRVHGGRVKERPGPNGRGKRWNEGRFFAAVAATLSESEASVVRDLYGWSVANAGRVVFGTGKETGSFTFHYLREGKTVSVFTVWTDGNLVLNYGWLVRRVETRHLEEFHHSVTAIPTLAGIPLDLTKWPSVRILDAFVGYPEALEAFKAAVLGLGEKIVRPS